MPSFERIKRNVIKQEVTSLVSEAIRSELKSVTDKFSKIVEENRNLRIRVDNLKMLSRSNNLVIHGKHHMLRQHIQIAEDVGGVVLRSPRQDTIRAVIDCCRSRMKLNVSSNDIVNCYRIPGSKGSRPIVVTFSGRGVRDKMYAAKKHYVEHTATHRSTSMNSSQRETQRYSQKKGNCLRKKNSGNLDMEWFSVCQKDWIFEVRSDTGSGGAGDADLRQEKLCFTTRRWFLFRILILLEKIKIKKIDFSSGKTKDNEHLSNFNSNLFAEVGQLLREKKRNFT